MLRAYVLIPLTVITVGAGPAARLHARDAGALARAREPFRYAYIAKNVTCKAQGTSVRHKYVSQVFGYCQAEVPKHQLLSDSQRDFERTVHAECGLNYDVSFEYVADSDTAQQAENEREKSLQETGYRKHVGWYASLDYYSSKCQ